MTTLQAFLLGAFPFVALFIVGVLMYVFRDRLFIKDNKENK